MNKYGSGFAKVEAPIINHVRMLACMLDDLKKSVSLDTWRFRTHLDKIMNFQ